MALPFISKVLSLFKKKAEDIKLDVEATIQQDGVLIRQLSGDGKADFSRFSIPLGQMVTKVKVYYIPDAVNGYGMALNTWGNYHKWSKVKLMTPLKTLETLSTALYHGKNVTQEDLYLLEKNFLEFKDYVEMSYHQIEKQAGIFYENNEDEDYVHWDFVNIGTVDDKIPYMRIHKHFFRHRIIQPAFPIENLKRDTHALDRLIKILGELEGDQDKVGEGEEYELYRKRQDALIDLAMRITDVLEMDCKLNELCLDLSRTPLNIAVYPVI